LVRYHRNSSFDYSTSHNDYVFRFRKLQLVDAVGGPEAATSHRTAIYLISATIAEFFADILLTPLEATRIRMVQSSLFKCEGDVLIMTVIGFGSKLCEKSSGRIDKNGERRRVS
jgi:hypothetical protein